MKKIVELERKIVELEKSSGIKKKIVELEKIVKYDKKNS